MPDLFEGQRTASATTPRPTSHSPVVMEAAAQDLTVDVVAWLGEGRHKRDPANVTADLLAALRWTGYGGFDIAKYLDQHGWDGVDTELVEILESARSYAWERERAAVRAWAIGQGDALTLPLGAIVEVKGHGRGPIVHLDHDQLTYGVRTPGMSTNGWLVAPYELCTLVDPAQTAEGA